ncbi:MAG: peptide-methionine (S)-S-oxide reductase MsrA [Candidatus Baltobacteraceae bacterium]
MRIFHVSLLVALQHAVFAGGCFWGMQAVFNELRGVSAVAGYAGGSASTAHYETVSTGETGHAESVDLTYDPAKISFDQLLDVYFLVAHDPTQLDRQGPDEGTQYRSEIFYTTSAQRELAKAKIAALERRHAFGAPIVTKVAPLPAFFRAEDYHQDYVAHNPWQPYVMINDKPKLTNLRREFPQLLKRG